jgi:hypothetical protein
MVLLMVMTIGYLPLILPVLLTGAGISAWDIARSLLFLIPVVGPVGIVLLMVIGGERQGHLPTGTPIPVISPSRRQHDSFPCTNLQKPRNTCVYENPAFQ